MAKSSQHYQGKLVIEKPSTRVTNAHGQEIIRTIRLLEDGSRVVEEKPAKKKSSARSEVPIVHATYVPDVEHQSPSPSKQVAPMIVNAAGSTTLPMVPYAAPPPVRPATTQIITIGGPQVIPLPYYYNRGDCCGCCSCGTFWGCCCFWTILIFLVLWLIGVLLPDEESLEDDYYKYF